MTEPLAFVFVIERGDLERQAILLTESIRTFATGCETAPVFAVQPRPGPIPKAATLKALARLNAVFIRADLNRAWPGNPFANKPAAASFVEELMLGTAETLVFVDTDVLFLSRPEELTLPAGVAVAVRPADTASHVGSPPSEPLTLFWEFIYRACGVDPAAVWTVASTVDEVVIRAYFNSGLIAINPEFGIFRRWQENFEHLANHPDYASAVRRPEESWFLDQASLAGTILAATSREEVQILSPSYSYPLHKQAELPRDRQFKRLDEAVCVHYHNEFYGSSWWKEISVSPELVGWLRERLPLPGVRRRLRASHRVRRFLAGPYRAITRRGKSSSGYASREAFGRRGETARQDRVVGNGDDSWRTPSS